MKKLALIILPFLLSVPSFSQSLKDFQKSGKKALKEKKYDVAVENFSKAIELDNTDSKLYYSRGEAYENLNNIQEAALDYVAASKLSPKKKLYNFSAGKTLFAQKNYKKSIPFLEKVIEIDKEYTPAVLLKSKAHYELGQYNDAYTLAERAVSLKQVADNYFQKGICAIALGKWADAEKALINAAKLEVEYSQVYTKLIIVRMGRGNNEKAVATADRAIKSFHKDKDAYYLRAEANALLGEYKESVDDISNLIIYFPKDEHAYYQRALYHLKNNSKNKAKIDFTKAINLNNNYIEAINGRAHIYDEMDEHTLASKDYESLTNIKTDNRDYLKLIENARHRVFEINKEDKSPVIKLIEPLISENNTISIVANKTVQELKIQITDDSKLESVRLESVELKYDKEKKNPFINYKIDLKDKDHIRIDVIDVYNNKSSETYNVKIKKIKPPSIKILEPYASTNGETYIDKDTKDLFVEGKVSHTENIASIKVNGVMTSFVKDKMKPVFSSKINVVGLNSFTVEVEDIYGTKVKKDYKLIRTEVSANNPMGKTWIIFIENSNYTSFSSLEGPTKDINLIKSSLGEYDISKIIHKKDMTKIDLEKFFAIELRDLIKKNRVNSLMVWYAGHGKFVNETGYWIPTDAKRDEEYSYFNINTLRASMQAYDKVLIHNLVITDACESGPSFYLAMRDAPEERKCGDWEATKFRSAQVLSSAGYELAMDNSQFTKTFASMLNHNPDACIPIEKISNKVVEAVVQIGNQKPSLGKIKGLSDQNGTFFFIKKEK